MKCRSQCSSSAAPPVFTGLQCSSRAQHPPQGIAAAERLSCKGRRSAAPHFNTRQNHMAGPSAGDTNDSQDA